MISTLTAVALLLVTIILILQFKNKNSVTELRNNQLALSDKLGKLVPSKKEVLKTKENHPKVLKNRNFDISKLSIDELIRGDKLHSSISEDRVNFLNSRLPDSFNGIIQSVSYLSEKNSYIVEFSDKGQKLLHSKNAAFAKKGNKLVPQLKVNGKYFEHAQLAGKGKDALRLLSKVSALAVGAAHIISGADISKKLEKIDGKLDLIIEDRTNELYSDLEAILKQAIELKYLDDYEYSRNEYRRLSKDIYRFRSRWKLRLTSKLNKIEDEHDIGWIKKFFTREKTRDKKMLNKLSQGQEEILMIKASLNLQMALAEERQEAEIFQKKILPAELNELRQVKTLLTQKSDYINKKFKNDGISADMVVDDFSNLIQQFEMFTYDEVTVDEIEEVEIADKKLVK